MDLGTKVTFPKTVFAQEVDEETILLDMRSENYFGLDEVGTAIWQSIEENDGDLHKVLVSLLAQYDVEEEIMKKDLIRFVDSLVQSGLAKVESV